MILYEWWGEVLLLFTNMEGRLLSPPLILPERNDRRWSPQSMSTTLLPWVDREEYTPEEPVLSWTVWEWLFDRQHRTTGVELHDLDGWRAVAQFCEQETTHRIPYVMFQPRLSGDYTYGRRWGNTQRVCVWSLFTPEVTPSGEYRFLTGGIQRQWTLPSEVVVQKTNDTNLPPVSKPRAGPHIRQRRRSALSNTYESDALLDPFGDGTGVLLV